MDCTHCKNATPTINYKDVKALRAYTTSEFKIGSSRRNKLCKLHQRHIAQAIKLARFMALMPYTRNQTVQK
ncbi:MAG: 30S ribosomal protein S18 [Patescibacteria group bacterium]